MTKQLAEIKPDDFVRITKERLPHQEIESILVTMGGGGVEGNQFKHEIVKAAGWSKTRLSSYAGSPDMAATVFNKIRLALMKTQKADELAALLRG